jgi:sarcosine oxidase/L-pipecolate oxidase
MSALDPLHLCLFDFASTLISRSGVLVLGSADSTTDYKDKSYANDLEMGQRVVLLNDQSAIRDIFPSQAQVGDFYQHTGYLNRDSGWANARQGLSILMSKITALNGKILGGKNVTELIHQGQKTTGVRCTDGTVVEADLVVLATGSWTASTFPDVSVGFQATGRVPRLVLRGTSFNLNNLHIDSVLRWSN